MIYEVSRDKLVGWTYFFKIVGLSFLWWLSFLVWVGIAYLEFGLWRDSNFNPFNFSLEENLVLIINCILVFLLICVYSIYKESNPEKVLLNQNGVIFNKIDILLRESKFEIDWQSVAVIEISTKIYRRNNLSHIEFKFIKFGGQIVLLPRQPRNKNTYDLRSALDDFVAKYNPKIKIVNAGFDYLIF